MKTREDVARRLQLEITHAFTRMKKDPMTRLYLYFTPTAPSCGQGGFLFCAEKPANPCYELATGEPVLRNASEEAVFNFYWPIVCVLPIMEID